MCSKGLCAPWVFAGSRQSLGTWEAGGGRALEQRVAGAPQALGNTSPVCSSPSSSKLIPLAHLHRKQGSRSGLPNALRTSPQRDLSSDTTKKILLCREDQFSS